MSLYKTLAFVEGFGGVGVLWGACMGWLSCRVDKLVQQKSETSSLVYPKGELTLVIHCAGRWQKPSR